jgi:hypothetical protein
MFQERVIRQFPRAAGPSENRGRRSGRKSLATCSEFSCPMRDRATCSRFPIPQPPDVENPFISNSARKIEECLPEQFAPEPHHLLAVISISRCANWRHPCFRYSTASEPTFPKEPSEWFRLGRLPQQRFQPVTTTRRWATHSRRAEKPGPHVGRTTGESDARAGGNADQSVPPPNSDQSPATPQAGSVRSSIESDAKLLPFADERRFLGAFLR